MIICGSHRNSGEGLLILYLAQAFVLSINTLVIWYNSIYLFNMNVSKNFEYLMVVTFYLWSNCIVFVTSFA